MRGKMCIAGAGAKGGIKFQQELMLFFCHSIIFTRTRFQLLSINHGQMPTLAANRARCLQFMGSGRHTLAAYAHHDCCLFMSNMEFVTGQTIQTQ